MICLLLAVLAQDAAKPLDLFRQRIAAAKSLQEKALAIRELGEARPPEAVPAIARYLAPQAGDCNVLLASTAVEALAKFRGSVAASRALVGAAEALRRHPYLHARIVEALGRVGHETGLALFDEALKGPDAAAAVRAIASFPPSVAVEALLVEGRKLERRSGEEVDRLRGELLKGLQRLTGEKYPSLAEFELWWRKRGPAFRLEAAAREKTERPEARPPGPLLLVELSFREGMGSTTLNSGASAGLYPSALLPGPLWTGQAPINAGPGALEWGKDGAAAVELGGGAGMENLKGLKSFTISGWLRRTEAKEDARLVSWLGKEGVDLLLRADGRLLLGVNQPAEQSTLASPPGLVPLADPKAADPNAAWRFVAVSYDATSSADHVKFYAGSWNDDAKRVGATASARGPSGTRVAPLRIGGRGFRGVLDEIRIHGGALPAEELVKLQNREAPAP